MDTRGILAKIVATSLSKVGVSGYAEQYLLDHIQDLMKPRDVSPYVDRAYLEVRPLYLSNIKISPLHVRVGPRKLTAHKLEMLDFPSRPNTVRQALIYLSGNNPFITDSLPNMEPLLQIFKEQFCKAKLNRHLVAYCQHYRGRGANQLNSYENFNDFSINQDALDQAALIKTLVAEYGPENVLVVGYSYGSAVALMALQHLLNEDGPLYGNVKFYSDRGYGNPLDCPFIKPFIYDQVATHARLYQKGIMPNVPLHDIVVDLPFSLVANVKGDNCIWDDFSLAATLQHDPLLGRVWHLASRDESNKHYSARWNLHLASIPEVTAPHLMAAMLAEQPILLIAARPPAIQHKPVLGYALRNGAQLGDEDFIPLAIEDNTVVTTASSPLLIPTNILTELVNKLDQYCSLRAARAAASQYGANYNHSMLGSTGLVGWTAKQQVEMATRILRALINNPDIEVLQKIKQEAGPHHSGGLGSIFSEIDSFITDYAQLQSFNHWAQSMKQARIERAQYAAELFADKWEKVSSTQIAQP